ncbi:MAG: CopG family transcriptional regulator [Butyrivibrio sp.]|nr:CopG family transcriptional regulator [Butyrivibrio sp.]
MANEKLIIKKRGEDGYKNFSIRISNETVQKLDDISKSANLSRNELIQIMLDYAIENCEIK